MNRQRKTAFIGWWIRGDIEPEAGDSAVRAAILNVTEPVCLVHIGDRLGAGHRGTAVLGDISRQPAGAYPLVAYAPALPPGNLGDPGFRSDHGLRLAYVMGAMANGITSVRMVEEAARSGMIAFFGAAGLPLEQVESAIDHLQSRCAGLPFGFNLIHTPYDPDCELETVKLYLRRGIRLVSASAYLDLTLPLIYYRLKGIHRNPDGKIVCPNRIIAKVSRTEVARKFLSPPPIKLLSQLVEKGWITPREADLAVWIPTAEDLDAEADSGGHTDNRPALALLPTMLALRDEVVRLYPDPPLLRIGLGGGIATPGSTAAAFAMGAAYVLTGSINQACIESGTSDTVRQMLAEATQADVAMAPAADMFEMGVKVQVLKRGTLFPFRAAKLYELYNTYDRYEKIPESQRAVLERDFFKDSFQGEWERTRSFFSVRDPRQIARAEDDPKHKMALVFRAYLGKSSGWANTGDPSRRIDYQIWCGPAMGSFNQWVRGSFLEKVENRKVVTVAMNLLLGAAVLTRTHWLIAQGAVLPAGAEKFDPMPDEKIERLLSPSSDS
jgi:PfaD family protein